MAEFNFNPGFDGDVKAELDKRKKLVAGKDQNWLYQKYAYVKFTSLKVDPSPKPGGELKEDEDYVSVFALLPKGGKTIGTIEKSGYLKSFHNNENDITTLKPVLNSVTVTANGGGDIYNSYISEVDVQFTVYDLAEMDEIQNEFFTLGSKAKLEFGWNFTGRDNDSPNKGELIINIYNFGFSMSTDGSFSCNVKGLTEGVFSGVKSISDAIDLDDDEKDALGKDAVSPASLPLSLKAKAYNTFGVKAGQPGLISNWINYGVGGLDEPGQMFSATRDNYTIKNGQGITDFYVSNLKEKQGDEEREILTYYIKFSDLITYINQGMSSTKQEYFTISGEHNKISKPEPLSSFGSADPRKFIFPGEMSKYHNDDYTAPDGDKFVNKVPSEYTIDNILISLTALEEYYDGLSGRINEKSVPPTMSKLISKIGSEIFRLSGGLVDIKATPETTNNNEKIENKYRIFNNTNVPFVPQEPYSFSVLEKNSIVKNVSLDSDFDTDVMLMMSVARAKKGEFNIKPLQQLYKDLPDITLDPKSQKKIDDNNQKGDSKKKITKLGIAENGIDDSIVSAVSDSMRTALTVDTKNGTFVSLPFYLKLSVTIDGINGLGFLQPIIVDRLPRNFKNSNVRFLITGIEHSFDGQGGWETKIDTAMKVGE